MASSNDILRSTLIIIAASLVVLLGAHELRKYHSRRGHSAKIPNMIQMFHGEIDISKNNIAQQAQQQSEKANERAQMQRDSSVNEATNDARRELKEFLNKLVP